MGIRAPYLFLLYISWGYHCRFILSNSDNLPPGLNEHLILAVKPSTRLVILALQFFKVGPGSIHVLYWGEPSSRPEWASHSRCEIKDSANIFFVALQFRGGRVDVYDLLATTLLQAWMSLLITFVKPSTRLAG